MTIGRTRIGPQAKNSIQTTDATADQLLLEVPIPFKHTATVHLYLTGICQATGDKLVVHSVHDVSRDGASATYNGLVSSDSYSSGAGAWVVTVDCSGTNMRVRVTGEAAHTIRWTAIGYFEASAVNVPVVWECSATPADSSMSVLLRVTNLVNYWLDWGDGTFDAKTGTGGDQTTTHNYASAGYYAIRVTVEDLADVLQLNPAGNSLAGLCPTVSAMTALTYLALRDNVLSGSIPALSSCPLLTHFYGYSNLLSGSIPSLSSNAALVVFHCASNSLSGTIPSLTNNVALTTFRLYTNQLTNYTASTIAATCVTFEVHNNLLPQSAVDQIMADFLVGAAGRPANGTINMGGTGNAPLSAAGLADKAAFLAIKPAWTITHN